MVLFIRKRKLTLGFFGEQGGESIDHDFESLAKTFSKVKPATDPLKRMLEEHSIVTSPSNREIVPTKKARNFKRKYQNHEEEIKITECVYTNIVCR